MPVPVMQPTNVAPRSRFGCAVCRRRHRKCDEQRPTCGQCKHSHLACEYQTTLKWTRPGGIGSFKAPKRPRRVARTPAPQDPLTSTSTGVPDSTDAPRDPDLALSPGVLPTSQGTIPPPNVDSLGQPSSLQWCNFTLDDGNLFLETYESNEAPGSNGGESNETSSVTLDPGTVEPVGAVVAFDDGTTGQTSQTLLDDDVVDDASEGASEYGGQDVASPNEFSSWVIDNTLSSLFLQIFQSPGEEIAFAYFFKRVCTCIPAFDGPQNPYRKMALVAISYPVLLHGMLSVSTGHMYNYGRSNDSLLSLRQARALTSLQSALNTLQVEKHLTRAGSKQSPHGLHGSGIFSILCAKEIALAAIMMQTSSVLMTGVGNVQVHMKCALHFIQELNYLHQLPSSFFARLLVYRFATVDVVLAHLRFRRPMAPPEFFMYQKNEGLDAEDPSFREMQGCPQKVLCFLAEIAVLSADLANSECSQDQIEAKAYQLETEMRIWGQKYYDKMLSWTSDPSPPTSSLGGSERTDLDMVCECFYWTAQLLLMRRVFLDHTKSTRVQVIRRHLFRLMDQLTAGCGPDSSLPFPFYMSAREALCKEDREWVRRKHKEMMETYRDRSREYLMAATEEIWDKSATTADITVPEGTRLWDTPTETFIREMDRRASFFMF